MVVFGVVLQARLLLENVTLFLLIGFVVWSIALAKRKKVLEYGQDRWWFVDFISS